MQRIPHCARLVEWLRNHGAHISTKLAIESMGPKGLGVRATEDVKRFEVLAKVPLRLCMNQHVPTILNENGKATNDEDQRDIKWMLIEMLMTERRKYKRSFHHPYISTLPKSLNALPLFWPEERLNSIKGTTVEMVSAVERRLLLRLFSDYHLHEQNPRELELFLWAAAISKTRMKYMNDHVAFVPFIDLLNHTDLYSDAWGIEGCVIVLDEDAGSLDKELAYHLVALADIPAGGELLVDYSLLSFQDKIVDYGILDKHNDLQSRFYTVAFQNFSDKNNPLLLSLWRNNVSMVLHAMVEEGVTQEALRKMLEARVEDLQRLCSDMTLGNNADCKFIRETDLFYTRYCSQKLPELLEKDRVMENLAFEEAESAQKQQFMSYFYSQTGLKIEI